MVVEISAFNNSHYASKMVHPLFDLMFVVSSIPRLHTAAYHLHKNCILEIIEFPWEWNLIKNTSNIKHRLLCLGKTVY